MWTTAKEIAYSICVHEDEILKALIKDSISIETYHSLKQMLFQTDVSRNKEFQNKFRDFYIMFRCPADYLSRYFEYMEFQKTKLDYDFKTISNDLFKASEGIISKEGKLQRPKNNFSFITKMMNLIYDDFPIYDKNVGLVFRYENQKNTNSEFIEHMKQAYKSIQTEHMIDSALERFAQTFSHYKIPYTKQVDFMLWKFGC